MDHRIVQKKLDILEGLATEEARAVSGWRARTARNPAAGQYEFDGDWRDISLAAAFPAGKTVFLTASAKVSGDAPLETTFLCFGQKDMEGLLSIDGKPFAGVDDNHVRVIPPRAGTLDLLLEYHSVPGAMCRPELLSTSGLFLGAWVRTIDRDVEAFCRDVRFAFETVKAISEPRRRQLLDDALEAALLAVDLTLPRERFLSEVAQAREILRSRVSRISPDPEAGSIYAVGHTHIDTAWLWPLKETVRKCGRTFSTACRLMERYPDYRFACSQPQLYAYTKQYYPDVFADIKKWAATGRWETTGAMWVEADCNVPGGESLIRQILHGLAFFKEEFGTRPRICWLPDVFGYPASLPEILAGCGIEYFYTYKLHWQAKNPFPDHLFHWRGLDGSEVLATVINHVGGYNNIVGPKEILAGWELYAQKAEYPEIIFPFGFGDGGGGVTEEMLEMCRRAEGHYPGLPAFRRGSAEGYFDDVVARDPQLPTWDGELYVETHRGTYTTQSALKRANRLSEILLREAEIWGSAAMLAGSSYDREVMDSAWKRVLLQQFHDILPGSSIPPVYVDALKDHDLVREAAGALRDQALDRLSAPVAGPGAVRVFNSLSWARRDPILVKIPPATSAVALVGPDGVEHAAQIVQRGRDGDTVVVEGLDAPPIGWADYKIAELKRPAASRVSASPQGIETPLFRIAITPEGGISSVFDKRYGREAVAPGGIANDLQLLQDGPENEDAWNIHETIDKRRYPFEGDVAISVVENGPVRCAVRITRRHRDSVIRQDIVATAESDRIDFVTHVDWQERQTMLKAAFPLAIRSLHATYEVQFGAVERPTHRNTSWDHSKFEAVAHRWADLSESGYGVSLLNDCRYGYDVRENVMRLTLLRSPIYPDPQADRGEHDFTYSLLPHAGSWAQAQTVRRAWELNAGAGARRISAPEPPRSLLELSGADVVVEAVKPAEDGRGIIVRLYEPHGARGEAAVKAGFSMAKAIACNLVEEDGPEVPAERDEFRFEIRPFQIRTFRLIA